MNHSARFTPTGLTDSTNIDRNCMAAAQVHPLSHSSTKKDLFLHKPTCGSPLPPQPPGPDAEPIESPSVAKQNRVDLNDALGPDDSSNELKHGAHPICSTRNATLNIADHSQTELLAMLSSLLVKITSTNDKLHSGPNASEPPRPGSPLLAFHARNIPSISIQSYLTRILKYCPMSSDIFLSLLVYFDRMSKVPTTEELHDESKSIFTSTRQLLGDEHHLFSIDSYNVHRLVITGIVVASKFCSDVFYTNSRYAKVSL